MELRLLMLRLLLLLLLRRRLLVPSLLSMLLHLRMLPLLILLLLLLPHHHLELLVELLFLLLLSLHEVLLLLHELLPRLQLLLLKLMRNLVVDEFVVVLLAAVMRRELPGRRCCWDSVLVIVEVGLVAEVVTMLYSVSPASARLRVGDHARAVERRWSGASAGGGRRATVGAVCRAAQAASVGSRQHVRGEEGLLLWTAAGRDSLAALFRRGAAGAA